MFTIWPESLAAKSLPASSIQYQSDNSTYRIPDSEELQSCLQVWGEMFMAIIYKLQKLFQPLPPI